MFYSEKSYVYLEDKFVKASEAKLSFYSQTLNYGNGVVEGIRAYKTEQGARIFKGKQHFERMQMSAHHLGLELDFDAKRLEEIAYELLEINHLENAYIRPIIFTGDSIGLQGLSTPRLFMGAFKWAQYLGKKPVSTCISAFTRPNPSAFPVEAKINGMYVNSIMASNHARKNGFQEAILLDIEGNIAQGPGTNLFIEKNGELFTPKRGHIMMGITRQTVLEIAQQEGIKASEITMTVEDLKNADSAFFTGTGAGIIGIKSVDDKQFDTSQNAIHPQLAEFYTDALRSSFGENYTII